MGDDAESADHHAGEPDGFGVGDDPVEVRTRELVEADRLWPEA